MLTAITCLILGGMLGLVTRHYTTKGKATARQYCRQCGNAPGYCSTAACYECVDYNNWVRHEG